MVEKKGNFAGFRISSSCAEGLSPIRPFRLNHRHEGHSDDPHLCRFPQDASRGGMRALQCAPTLAVALRSEAASVDYPDDWIAPDLLRLLEAEFVEARLTEE